MASMQVKKTPDMFALAAELQAQMEAAVVSVPTAASVQKTSQKSTASILSSTVGKANHRLKTGLRKLWSKSNEPPLVSIVILAFNKVEHTIRCLEILSRQKSHHRFEIVLVDNNSTDLTPQLVRGIPGIRYVRNDVNKGFVGGCNDGVKHSRGKVIVLLNNDTLVGGNWLDPLVDRLMSDETIGMVGSKLIYPDGSLQEAGGIVFSDASGHNFGKHKKADDFEFNYSREVDYCSAASVAFWHKDFIKLGGFDTRYAPAYYEDTDLAMSMRHKLKKRVMYEPRSVVVHLEGVTAGTDVTSGFKRFQAVNHNKFLKKWKKELAKNHYPPGTAPLIAAQHGKRPRILVVDSIVPEHNRDSGSLRMFQILKSLVEIGYDVTFFADNRVATLPYTEQLQALGIEVVYGSRVQQDFYRDRHDMYQVVLLSRPTTAIWHLEYCKAYLPNARILYDTVDLHYLRIQRQAETDKDATRKVEAEKWRQLEYYLMDNTDATLLVSYEEQKLLKKDKPAVKTFTVSNINPRPALAKNDSLASRTGLLFMGDYSRAPNYAAARWFVQDILPLIHKELPGVKLTLLGSNPAAIEDLAGPNVIVTGFQEAIAPYYNQARIFVCPLRYGAGVKGKVSESIAYGLPVVSTAIGTEGMHLKDGISSLGAETPEEFVRQIVRLYNDVALWTKLSRASKVVYDQYFSEAAGVNALKDAL